MAKLLWLLCMIVPVLASNQYTLDPDYEPCSSAYICGDSARLKTIYPICCPGCIIGCPGYRSLHINATNATEVFGAINVVHDGTSTTLKALADLTTRRNFITSTLVDDLSLDGEIQKFSDVDIHSISISGHNVTITTFVLLSIGVGIDNRLITDKIFEIIPEQKSCGSDFAMADLILGLSFLNDAGALGINQAVFITNY